jgi:hypothetical protein
MMNLEVREATSSSYPEWDRLVIDSPQGTIFHTSGWLSTMSHHMGKEMTFLQCCDTSSRPPRTVGGCAFLTYKKLFSRIATDRFVATPYGGIFLLPPPTNSQSEIESWHNRIVNSFVDKFGILGYDLVRLVHCPTLFDVRPFILDGWNCNILYTYVLDLKENLEKEFSKEARWTIKKAIKREISIYKIDVLKPSHILSYWNLHSMTFQRQGGGYRFPQSFFTQILGMLYEKKKGTLWFAETTSGEIVGAEIIVYDNKMAHRWSAASHTELQKTGAVSLLLYEIAKYLRKELGYEKFNLMAANTPQLARFISAFNPRLVPYYSTTKAKSFRVRALDWWNIL